MKSTLNSDEIRAGTTKDTKWHGFELALHFVRGEMLIKDVVKELVVEGMIRQSPEVLCAGSLRSERLMPRTAHP
jgi:hypothetical protein